MDRTVKEDTGVKQQILRRMYLFSGISEADLKVLARMAIRKTFLRQATIFSEGKEAQGFYLLITGQIKLLKSSPEGKEYIIRLVGPGETFAELLAVFEIEGLDEHAGLGFALDLRGHDLLAVHPHFQPVVGHGLGLGLGMGLGLSLELDFHEPKVLGGDLV